MRQQTHPFIYDKTFPDNPWTFFWRFFANLNCSISISQLALQFFHGLEENKKLNLITGMLYICILCMLNSKYTADAEAIILRFKINDNSTYRALTLWIQKNNPQYLLYCYLILLLIKLKKKKGQTGNTITKISSPRTVKKKVLCTRTIITEATSKEQNMQEK